MTGVRSVGDQGCISAAVGWAMNVLYEVLVRAVKVPVPSMDDSRTIHIVVRRKKSFYYTTGLR